MLPIHDIPYRLIHEPHHVGTIGHPHHQLGPTPIYAFHNGRHQTLVNNNKPNYNPAVDPEGKWMIYTSEDNGKPALYAFDLSERSNLPQPLMVGDAMQDSAAISPDGQTLYFVSTRDGANDIYSIDFFPMVQKELDEAVNLTKGVEGLNPAISPDGRRIAFTSTSHCPPSGIKTGNIYIMNNDGTDIQQITFNKDWDDSPVWSLDGSHIVYQSIQNGTAKLYQFSLATLMTEPIKKLEHCAAISPLFLPSGRLAFVHIEGLKHTIVSVHSSEEAPDDFRLESDPKIDCFAPTVTPSGELIVYGKAHQDKRIASNLKIDYELV